jgi:hypothetical protein
MPEITSADFARSFAASEDEFSVVCRESIRECDFSYKRLNKKQRDKVILHVLKKIATDTQIIGAKERTLVWEKGWAENLRAFNEQNHNLDALIPKFIRENQPIRYDGDYIMPANPRFEYDFMTVFRLWLFEKYFSGYSNIYEFGCGSGLNLALLASLFPNKSLYGLDFVQSSVDLINSIGKTRRWRMSGHLFDMIKPNNDISLAENSAVFTFGALEQLASRFENFIQYLLVQKPSICIHVEPTVELYDEDVLFDYLAIQFHRKRGYTENFLPRLKQLESEGKAKLLKVKRLQFGSLFMEGYTCIIWQPIY